MRRKRVADPPVFSNSPTIWHHAALFCLACQLLGLPRPLFGQSLRLSAATASPGEEVAIEISLESPDGKEPLALQWETQVPGALRVIDCSLPEGAAVKELGKMLKCAATGNTAEAHTSRCILAGGVKTIPNGPLALLRLGIPRAAQPGPFRIRISEGIAVSKDLEPVPLPPADTLVTIRK